MVPGSHVRRESPILRLMKTTTSLSLFAFLSCIAVAASAGADATIGQHVPPFTAQVIDVSTETPATMPFDSTTTKRITAYMVLGVNCPASKAYATRVSELQKQYAAKDVDFIFVYSNREDTLDGKIAFHREHQLGGKLIDDKGGEIAKKLGAKRTSELFLCSQDGTLVYHGAVDDSRDPGAVKQRYLQMALDETIAGAPVKVSTSPVSA